MRGECPDPQPDCKYFPDCYSDRHHEWFPKSEYKTRIERKFRRLGRYVVEICRREHEDIHAQAFATGEFPEKPSREMMEAIIIYERNSDE